MRILFVTSLYAPWLGGLEVLIGQLARELTSRGHEVAVVTAVNDVTLPLGVTSIAGVDVLRIDAYRCHGRPSPMDLLTERRLLRNFLSDFRPDVIHSHDSAAVLVLLRSAAAPAQPLVMTLHNVMTLLTPQGLSRIASELALADAVTGVSQDVVADARAFASDLRAGVELVANGISSPAADRKITGIAGGPPRFLCVGRLVAQKRFDRALAAMARVVEREPSAQLTLVGVGPLQGELHQQAQDLGIGQNVTLTGRVEPEAVPALFESSTALIMPSAFEGLPLVALEAAWSGRPVIGFDVPGLRCAVDHNVTGLLVEDDDVNGLAEAMLLLAADHEAAEKLGLGAREAAERRWSMTQCASGYEQIYQRLVGPA